MKTQTTVKKASVKNKRPTDSLLRDCYERISMSNTGSGDIVQLRPLIYPTDTGHNTSSGQDWEIVLRVGVFTTADELKKAIPAAIELRSCLLESTEGDLLLAPSGWEQVRIEIMEANLRKHLKGTSYSAIAEKANNVVACDLKKHVAESTTVPDDECIPVVKPLDHARHLLLSYGFKSNEVTEIIEQGLSNIKDESAPFEKGYPLSAEQVKYQIQAWKNNPKRHIYRRQRERT